MEDTKERIAELAAMLVEAALGSTSEGTFLVLAEHAKREIMSLQEKRRERYGAPLDRSEWASVVSGELRRRAEITS